MRPFDGLKRDAFDAYLPAKWASNVHNLPRMRVKESMLALADAVQEGLSEELAGLARAASDEIPNILNHKKVDAQWIYWTRDNPARQALATFLEKLELDETALLHTLPQDKHVILGLVLRHEALWLGLRVASGAAVDRRNLAAKLAKSWERERLLELLAALPDETLFGPEDAARPVRELDAEGLSAQAEALGPGAAAWCVGVSLPAAEVLELGADLAPHLADKLARLAPLYRFVAWTQDNDHIEVGKQLEAEKAEKRRQAAGVTPGDRVRIVSGVFAGKIGVVQEIDGKSQVKVSVGKLSVVVPGAELTPAS